MKQLNGSSTKQKQYDVLWHKPAHNTRDLVMLLMALLFEARAYLVTMRSLRVGVWVGTYESSAEMHHVAIHETVKRQQY